jgi:hypothetical protein
MAYFWQADDAVAAVRSLFETVNWELETLKELRAPYRPVEVTRVGDELVVQFHYRGYTELFAVRFSLDRMPEGPCTGEVCQTVEQWAQEIDLTMDEEIGTQMVQTAERTVADDGVVTLLWRSGSGTR